MENKSIEFEFLREQISQINKNVEKLADSQIKMNSVLIENTVIVKEHERRSTAFEGWAAKFEERMGSLNLGMSNVNSELIRIDEELKPIRSHVKKVSKIINFIDGVPVLLKFTVLVFTILSAMYGAFLVIHSLMPRK
jgi:methyl-accepting chemotaxis protein